MELFLKWLLLAGVQSAATISPGPAFAVMVRNAVAYDRRTGIMTAIGLGIGVGAHVLFVLGGIAVILSQSVYAFNAVKYIGAAYLIYIGIKALRTPAHAPQTPEETITKQSQSLSDFKALRMGFLTNLLNPKAVIFFTAVFTQFIDAATPIFVLALFGLTSVAVEIIWFSLLALFLNSPRIKSRYMAMAHWIERICGGLLLALGVRLALSKMH